MSIFELLADCRYCWHSKNLLLLSLWSCARHLLSWMYGFMSYSSLMDLTENQIKSFTDSRKTLQRFFSLKNKAYFRSFNLNHSILVFYVFFVVVVVLVSVEIEIQMATVTKKGTQCSVHLSTIDNSDFLSFLVKDHSHQCFCWQHTSPLVEWARTGFKTRGFTTATF